MAVEISTSNKAYWKAAKSIATATRSPHLYVEERNKMLAEFNAVAIPVDDGKIKIRFNTDADYTAFLLRWA